MDRHPSVAAISDCVREVSLQSAQESSSWAPCATNVACLAADGRHRPPSLAANADIESCSISGNAKVVRGLHARAQPPVPVRRANALTGRQVGQKRCDLRCTHGLEANRMPSECDGRLCWNRHPGSSEGAISATRGTSNQCRILHIVVRTVACAAGGRLWPEQGRGRGRHE